MGILQLPILSVGQPFNLAGDDETFKVTCYCKGEHEHELTCSTAPRNGLVYMGCTSFRPAHFVYQDPESFVRISTPEFHEIIPSASIRILRNVEAAPEMAFAVRGLTCAWLARCSP